MKSIRFIIASVIVCLVCNSVNAEGPTPLGTWNGTIDSDNYPNGGTISNWAVRADGTTEGEWIVDIGGGTVISFNPSGNYTYLNGVFEFDCSGTATESGYGTTSTYFLSITNGTISSRSRHARG